MRPSQALRSTMSGAVRASSSAPTKTASSAASQPAERIISQLASRTTPLTDDDMQTLCATMWDTTEDSSTPVNMWLAAAASSASQAVSAAVCQFAFGAVLRASLLLLSRKPELGRGTSLNDMLAWLKKRAGAVSAHENLLPSYEHTSTLLRGTAPAALQWMHPGLTAAHVVELGATWAAVRGLWVVLEGLGMGLRGAVASRTCAVAAVNAAAADLGITFGASVALQNTTHESALTQDAYGLLGWLDGSALVPGGEHTQAAAGSPVGRMAQWRPLQCGPLAAAACMGSSTHALVELVNRLDFFDSSTPWMPEEECGVASEQLAQLVLCSSAPSAAQWAMQHIALPALLEGNAADAGGVVSYRGLVLPMCASGQLAQARRALALHGDGAIGDVQLDTALMLAAYNGHTDCVEWLVRELGMPVDRLIREDWLLTPLHAAAFAGHVDVIEVLLAAGASTAPVFDEDGKCGQPAMHRACAGGHIAAVRRLWEAGAAAAAGQPLQHLGIPHPVECAVGSGNPEVLHFVIANCDNDPGECDMCPAAIQCCWDESSLPLLAVMYVMGVLSAATQSECVAHVCQDGSAEMLRSLLELGFVFDTGAAMRQATTTSKDGAEKWQLLQSHGGWMSQSELGEGRASILYYAASRVELNSAALTAMHRTGRCNDPGDGTSIFSMAGQQSRSAGMSVAAGRSSTSAFQRMLVAGADPKAVDSNDRSAMTELLMQMGSDQEDDREDPVEIRNLVSFGMDTQRGRGRTWPKHLQGKTDQRLKQLYLE